MNDLFTTRVKAAAAAGWWTVLIGIGFNVFLWLAFRHLSDARPQWILGLWGHGIDYDHLLAMFLRAIIVVRVLVWIMLMVTIWLSLWARQLRKRLPRA